MSSGPYRFSRNPIYLSFAIFSLGVALLVNSGWGLLLLIPAVLSTHYLAILPEERYLGDKFGGEYLAYCARVRRWV